MAGEDGGPTTVPATGRGGRSARRDAGGRWAIGAAVAVLALGLTACGGGDESGGEQAAAADGTSTTARGADRAEVQECLKKQGVELPGRGGGGPGGGGPGGGYGGPPPGGGGGGLPGDGLPGGGPSGGGTRTGPEGAPMPPGRQLSDADREKLQKALKACGVEGRFGPGARGGRGGRPDLSSSEYRKRVEAYVACVRKNGYDLPDPDFSGDGPIFDEKKVDRDDADFRKASAACQSELRPDRSQGSGSGGSSSGTTPSGASGSQT